jgi:hypothetical protein
LTGRYPNTGVPLTTVFHDQAQILAEPMSCQLFLDYDQAYDLDPHDPRIDDLARRIVDAIRERYGADDLPGQDTDSEIPALIQGAVNASSPAWRRLDTLIRTRLGTRRRGPRRVKITESGAGRESKHC